MGYRITGLPVESFAPLFALDDDALAQRGIARCIADAPQAFPCRITLEDALPGEEMLLLSYAQLAAPSPYASSGPIFVRRHAVATRIAINEVPDQQRRRLLSVRAYDSRHTMVDADVIPGTALESLIERFFREPQTDYLHVHNARRGCYACKITRAGDGP